MSERVVLGSVVLRPASAEVTFSKRSAGQYDTTQINVTVNGEKFDWLDCLSFTPYEFAEIDIVLPSPVSEHGVIVAQFPTILFRKFAKTKFEETVVTINGHHIDWSDLFGGRPTDCLVIDIAARA